MLLDTRSGITIIREDVWKATASRGTHQSLKEINHPVFAANGEELDVAGQAAVILTIGTFKASHPVMVVRHLTQSCLQGADFLCKHHCIMDLKEERLTNSWRVIGKISVN